MITVGDMLQALLAPGHYVQRQTDLRILWPICKREAEKAGLSLDHAKAAFMTHAMHDGAWLCLGEDEIVRRIDRLT